MLPFNFNHLYYFYVAARGGSISEAARELRISQSSVSIQIKQFEESLGHRLLDRIKRGVELTESGQIVFQYAERVFQDVGRVREALEAIEYQVRGSVSVGTVNSIGIYVLPEVVKLFNEAFPEARVSIDLRSSRELVEAVRIGRIDLAILVSSRRYEGLTGVPLRKNKMFLVAPPDHPILASKEITLGLLERYPFIGYEEGMEGRMMTDALFRRMSLSVEYVMESSNVASIKHMVMAGLGLAILPETVVGDEIRRGLLVRPELPSIYLVQDVTLYYKTSRVQTPTRKKFVEVLGKYLGREGLQLPE